MSRSDLWRFLLFLGLLGLIIAGFIWFLYLRQDRITHLQLEAPMEQQKPQFDKFDVERQELDPVQDSDQLDIKQEASLYTALKTLRGEVVRFVPTERSLVIKPTKNDVLGTKPVTVDLNQLDEIVCWPEYYQANDGSKVALSEAYITIQPTREEFYWTNQKVWPYNKAAGQIASDRHVLVKLDQDLTAAKLVASQLVIVGCKW